MYRLNVLKADLMRVARLGSICRGHTWIGNSAFPKSATASHLVGQTVPANLIIVQNGLEWVWASPCSGGCSTITLHSNWRYATDAELANRPPNSAFGSAGNEICATPYFDNTFDHCDWSDLAAGNVTSQPNGGSDETLLVRGEVNTSKALGPNCRVITRVFLCGKK